MVLNQLKNQVLRNPRSKAFRAYRPVLEQARGSRLSSEQVELLLKDVEEKMRANPNFFNELEELRGDKLKIYRFGRHSVVIKNLNFAINEKFDGADYKAYNSFYNEFKKRVKARNFVPSLYRLVRIKPYGIVRVAQNVRDLKLQDGSFLVMDAINPATVSEELKDSYKAAIEEMNRHVSSLERDGVEVPQYLRDIVPVGHTNPAKPAKGVWLIALPHDRLNF